MNVFEKTVFYTDRSVLTIKLLRTDDYNEITLITATKPRRVQDYEKKICIITGRSDDGSIACGMRKLFCIRRYGGRYHGSRSRHHGDGRVYGR